MAVGNKSIATQVVEDCIKFYEEMKEILALEFQHSVGYTEVSRKETRSLIRKAMDGDQEAMGELETLSQANQYPDGRNPVEEEINQALADHKKNMPDTIFSSPNLFGD